jgi:hypothetical protein
MIAGEVSDNIGVSRHSIVGDLINLPASPAHAEFAAVICLKPMAEQETDEAHG